MKGEDKMNRTIIRIGIAVGLLIGFGQNIKAQTPKKPIDIDACRVA